MITKSYEIKKNLINFLKYNLFLLYGENYGLKKDIKESIISSICKQDNNLEILTLYENDIIDNEEDFYNSVYSGSLFGNKKIITIMNGSDKIIEQVKDINDKYPKNMLLIIFASALEKKSKLRNFFEKNSKTQTVPCYPDTAIDLRNIAFIELKKNKIDMSNEVINLLIEKSNNDRNNLMNEIEKIKLLAINKKKLKIDDIKSIISFSGEYKSDNFIIECLCGNISQYKKILSELFLNTVDQIFFLRILSNKIHRLLNMKKIQQDYKSLDNLLNTAKPPIFWKEKPLIKKQMTIWNFNDLKKIVIEINSVEILCKKNPQSSKIIFFDFFTKICKKASNYS